MKITNKRILITGASGYIGGMLVKELYKDNKISVIVRSRDKCASFPDNVNAYLMDIKDEEKILSISDEFDYIVHCAAPTKSSFMIKYPQETYNTIVQGAENLLKLAVNKKIESMVYLSSMEVYGIIDNLDRVTESELGYVDEKNPRSCYPLGKRKGEELCRKYYQEYGVPVKIARLSQTFGRGILAGESRVFAGFAQSVINEQDIILKTTGQSMGNYCGIDDTLEAIKLLLIKGEDGEVYNVVNEDNTMTILEMAQLVANEIAKGRIKVQIKPENPGVTGYAPETKLRLSGAKLVKLGWEPTQTLIQMYNDIIL